MNISFSDKIVNTSNISTVFLSQYNDLRKNESNIEKCVIKIEKTVEVIDEVLYSYIYLFKLEFPHINLEFIFNNSNEKLKSIAQNKLKLIPKCKFSSPLLNPKKEVFEEKSISPLIKVSNECLQNLFKSNNFLEQTTKIIKADTNFKKHLNSKTDFFNYFKSIKSTSLVWQYYLAILDDLSILRMFYFSENQKIEFKVENYSKTDSEKIVKDIYFTLRDNGFFQFNEVQIYFFRLFIDKIKPKENEFRDDRQNKKIKDFCTRLFNLISYIKLINTGIKELATNIVEHSGDLFGEGFGVISARVFSKDSFIRNKKIDNILFEPWIETSFEDDYFLDLNIIDCGKIDLRESYINKVEDFDDADLSEDIERLTNEELWMLFDYQNIQMIHQTKRYNASLGLLIFSNLILSKKGFIRFTTNNLKNDVCESFCLYYNDRIVPSPNTNELNKIGTSYNFIIPFNSFRKKDIAESTNTYQKFINSNESYINSNELFNYKYYSDIKNCTKDDNNLFLVKVSLPDNLIPDKYKKVKFLSDYLERHFVDNMIPIIYSDDPFFKTNFESSSDWFRFLSDYNYMRKKPLIVIGDEDFYQKKYNEIIKINTCFEDSETDFWSNDCNLIFYINREYLKGYKKLNIWFNSVLSGNSFNEFIKLNSNVNNYQEFNLVVFEEIDLKLIEETHLIEVQDNFFYKNERLLNFEVLIDSNKKSKLFLETVTSLLNLDISSWEGEKLNNDDQFFQTISGFKITDSHFKLGSKIHIKDFYYAKPMFYNSFYVNRLAFIMAISIIENQLLNHNLNKSDDITLIGYENYSELLVSQIRNILNEYEAKKYENHKSRVRHDIYVNEAVSKRASNVSGKIILIVPISSTLTTQNKIYADLERIALKENNSIEPLFPDLTTILVAPENYDNLFSDLSKESNPKDKSLAQVFDLNFSNGILFSNRREQKHFINLFTDWHLIYKCELCTPKNYKEERCLIETESNSITPDLIFDLPKISKPYEGNLFELLFNSSYKVKENENELNNPDAIESKFFNVIATPTTKSGYNYKFFIKSSSFLYRSETNKVKINEWLETIKNNFEKDEKIILLKQSENSFSGFADKINELIFNDKATILQFSPKDENIQNFQKFHKNLFKNAKIIYVDDVLAYGKSFLSINDYVKTLGLKIDSIITLCNKMNYYDENNIKSYLNKEENIFAFAKINIPTLLSFTDDEHFIIKNVIYSELVKKSLLDLSRLYFSEKLNKSNPINLNKKSSIPTTKPKCLFYVLLYHEIYSIFYFENIVGYKNNEIIKSLQSDSIDTIPVIYKHILNTESIKSFRKKFDFFSDEDVRLNILKILSEPPFKGHKEIKEKLFNYVLAKIIKLDFNKPGIFTYTKNNAYCEYQNYKLLLRIGVNLNINYIYSIDFLLKIMTLINRLKDNNVERKKIEFSIDSQKLKREGVWNLIEDKCKNQFNAYGFITYFSCLIQELILEDDAKAPILVENIWKIVNNKFEDVSTTIRFNYDLNKKPSNDFHYDFGYFLKILILENNFVFERFFNNFYKSTKSNDVLKNIVLGSNTTELITDEVNDYYENYRNEAPELMLWDYNQNDIDVKLKNVFIETIKLKTLLRNEVSQKEMLRVANNESSNNNIKTKVFNLLEQLCKIMDIEYGGAYLTIRYNNKKVSPTLIKCEDLYTISEYPSSDDYELNIQLEQERSIVLDMFKGINDVGSKKTKSTFEMFRANVSDDWDYKKVQVTDYVNHMSNDDFLDYNDLKPIECDFEFNNNQIEYTNLFFLRISDINEDLNIANPIAVISFYADKRTKHFDPKNIRFLLLLRDNIKEFINYHLDNDSLSSLISQEERNKYQIKLNHDSSDYVTNFDYYIEKLRETYNDNEDIEYLSFVKQHLVNKINLIANEVDEGSCVLSFNEIENDLKNILTFRNGSSLIVEKSKIRLLEIGGKSDLLHVSYNSIYWTSVFFEIVYNLRKYTISNLITTYYISNDLEIFYEVSEGFILFKTKYYNIKSIEKENKKFTIIARQKKSNGLSVIEDLFTNRLKLKNKFKQFITSENETFFINIKIPLN